MLQQFKNIHNAALPSTDARKKYGEPYPKERKQANGHVEIVTIDPICERIIQLLSPTSKDQSIPFKTFGNLQREIIYRTVIYSESLPEYLPVLGALTDCMRLDKSNIGLKPLTCVFEWTEAISLMKEMFTLGRYNSWTVAERNLRSEFPKDYDIAKSALFMVNKYSCKIEIKEDGDLEFIKGLDKVIQDIEKRIEVIGGLTLISFIFTALHEKKTYSTFVNRYLIGRHTSMMTNAVKPDLPIGFLLNIALKFPFQKNGISNLREQIQEIYNISIAYTNAVYGSQHYNIWEIMFNKGEHLVQFTKDISIYDTIFSFDQGDLKTEIQTIRLLLDFVPNDEFVQNCNFSLTSFLSVMEEIERITEGIHVPFTLHKSSLRKTLNLNAKEINEIFATISHSGFNVNTKYESPAYYAGIDFWKKPLLKINDNKYILANRNWCAKAFYEAVATKLRKRSTFDIEIGPSLEKTLKALLRTKGIQFYAGKYNQSGIEGECDLAIETDKIIVLFESKKKNLTGMAKSGSDINIVIDLAQSLLDSQVQACRTELLLRKDKAINLFDPTEQHSYQLKYSGQRIFRISLSHLDYRGFHDKAFINNFLETMLTHSIETFSKDEKIVEKFKDLGAKQNIHKKQYNEFFKYNPRHDHLPYIVCFFNNLDHFSLMLNLSENKEQFVKYLTSMAFINATGSLNFYKEFQAVNFVIRKEEVNAE